MRNFIEQCSTYVPPRIEIVFYNQDVITSSGQEDLREEDYFSRAWY